MKKLEDLTVAVRNLEADFVKFYEKGQAAAGTRLRKGLSELRKLAQDARKEIQETKHWLRMLSVCLAERKEELRIMWQEAQELTLIFGKILSSSRNSDIK